MGELILGNYIALNELGCGGMACVYQGLQISLKRPVAIKKIHPHLIKRENFVKRFEREAKVLATLDQENIISIIDYGQDLNSYFIIMQYVDGISLKKLIQKKGPLPLNISLAIFEGMLYALDYAHKKGIIHRDIKPDNILINRDGSIRVADFGISQIQGDTELTQTGGAIGSPHYMAPEQALDKPVDSKSDMYSASLVMMEMLTGKKVVAGSTNSSIYRQVAFGDQISLKRFVDDIPLELLRILQKALYRNPEKRFSSTKEFLKRIQKFAEKHGGIAEKKDVDAYIEDCDFNPVLADDEIDKTIKESKEQIDNQSQSRETTIVVEPTKTEKSQNSTFIETKKPFPWAFLATISVFIIVISTVLAFIAYKSKEYDQRYSKLEELQQLQHKRGRAIMPTMFGEDIIKVKNFNTDIQNLLIDGDLAMLSLNFVEAEKYYMLAGDKAQEPQIEYLLAFARYNKQEFESAIHALDRAVEYDPKFAEAYNFRATVRIDIMKNSMVDGNKFKEYELIYDDLSRALELKDNFALAYNNRGLLRFYIDDDSLALIDFDKAIDLKPDLLGAYNNRANLKKKLGDYKGAIEDYSRAIRVEPEFENAYFNRGKLYFLMGEKEKALSDYDKFIELSPQMAYPYNNRGYLLLEFGEIESALSDFKRVIELDPDYELGYLNLAELYLIYNKPKDALLLAEKALSRFDLHPSRKAPLLLISNYAKMELFQDNSIFLTEYRNVCLEDFKSDWNFDGLIEWIYNQPDDKKNEYLDMLDLLLSKER